MKVFVSALLLSLIAMVDLAHAERTTVIRNRDGSLTRLTTDDRGNHHWVHETGGGGQSGGDRTHRDMVRELTAGGGTICRGTDCNRIRRLPR